MGQCESLVKSNEAIMIAALLEGEQVMDWYVREGVPVPKEETWKQMIIRVQILLSMLKSTEGYLGDFNHVRIQHDLGVVYIFPLGVQKALSVVTKPEKEGELVRCIKDYLTKMG